MLSEWTSSPPFSSSHGTGGGRRRHGDFPSLLDSANTSRVNPAGSMTQSLTASLKGRHSYPHFLCEETETQSQGFHISQLQGEGSSSMPFSLGLLIPSPVVSMLGAVGAVGREVVGAACLPRSGGHAPPLDLASNHTEHAIRSGFAGPPLLPPACTVLSTWNAVLPPLLHLADSLHVLHGPTPVSPPRNPPLIDCPRQNYKSVPAGLPQCPG